MNITFECIDCGEPMEKEDGSSGSWESYKAECTHCGGKPTIRVEEARTYK